MKLSKIVQSWLFLSLIGRLPVVISKYIILIITQLSFEKALKTKTIIKKNVMEVLSYSNLYGLIVKGIAKHYWEKCFLIGSSESKWKKYLLDKCHVLSSSLDVLENSIAKSKSNGVVFVAPHFGGIEFLPGYLTLIGFKVSIVVKFTTDRLRQRSLKRAASVGAKIIDVDKQNPYNEMIYDLKNGRIVIVQNDEFKKWHKTSNRTIRMFGRNVYIDSFIQSLSSKSGCPVVFGYLKREDGFYRLNVSHVRDHEPDTHCLLKLEHLILESPEQWYVWKDFQYMFK